MVHSGCNIANTTRDIHFRRIEHRFYYIIHDLRTDIAVKLNVNVTGTGDIHVVALKTSHSLLGEGCVDY